jgi:predicted Zn finger-like uncharacterized protein
MLVICSNCKARLQLDEGKIPSHTFKVRCPKCQGGIEIKSPSAKESEAAGETSLPADMTPPSPHVWPFERPAVAAPFKAPAEATATATEPATGMSMDVVKLLSELVMRKDAAATKAGPNKRPSWDRRKALICTEATHRDAIANGLAAQDYEVFIADNTAGALGRMREDQIDVLILDANFDPSEQGYAFVMRELKLMRPSERRRIFLTYVTENARTMDLHAAFLHNANLVVNPSEIERLPEALDVSLRHYNELYREVYRALEQTPI